MYCGATENITDEHVFPDWVRRILGIPEGTAGTLSVNGVDVEEGALEIVLHAVCKNCNAKWGNLVEQKVRKWIGDSIPNWREPFTLGPYQRRVTAAWAVKTALLLEIRLRGQRRPSLAPPSHLRYLLDHLEHPLAPPGSRVWMFGVEPEPGVPWTAAASTREPTQTELPIAYFATFTIGYIGFQVFGPESVPSDLDPDLLKVMETEPPAHLQSRLQRIWPSDEVYRWPPDEHFANDELVPLADWPHHATADSPHWYRSHDGHPQRTQLR